jgi:hypothetical protein
MLKEYVDRTRLEMRCSHFGGEDVWIMTPFCLVLVNQRFGGTFRICSHD